jgi:trans-aconitate 2-methyltransferase
MNLQGEERVLDAGCGTGQVTARLRDRLPSGHVVALDGSPSMIDAARERLGLERVSYLLHDLLDPIPIAVVDAVVSTATFHWIRDHERLFANLAAVIRPGGALEAQCGGSGNIARIEAIVRTMGHGDAFDAKRFPGVEETTERLESAGFVDVRCWLTDEPTPLPADDLEPYLATVCLGGVTEQMSHDDASRLVHEVAGAMQEPLIDYVRLTISAHRAS